MTIKQPILYSLKKDGQKFVFLTTVLTPVLLDLSFKKIIGRPAGPTTFGNL